MTIEKLPICQLTTLEGEVVIGALFMRNERVVVLLNNTATQAHLGEVATIRMNQMDPEADLFIVPTGEILHFDVLSK